jgi:hypothetical protein
LDSDEITIVFKVAGTVCRCWSATEEVAGIVHRIIQVDSGLIFGMWGRGTSFSAEESQVFCRRKKRGAWKRKLELV